MAPRPERTTAVLMSEGVPHRPTIHTYERTERVGKSWVHMFRCSDTGKVRRWGIE